MNRARADNPKLRFGRNLLLSSSLASAGSALFQATATERGHLK